MTQVTRREFVRRGASAAAAAACAGARRAAARTLNLPMGLQLYSVRNLLPRDFDGTLAAVRSAGYAVVEAAGFYGRAAADFRRSMDAAGLRCVSAHYTLALLESQLDQTIDYATDLGLEYIVCSSSDGMHRDPTARGAKTLDDWLWIADEFNRIGDAVKSAGVVFGVHNHTPEFAVLDGLLVYDQLLRHTDPSLVVFEMDCGWVYASGHNPVDYLSEWPQRFPLLHIKDMIREPDGKIEMPVLGKGRIDYAPILRAATGLRYAFVEQEEFQFDPIEELRQDAAYLRNLRF
jgi:sugar phosphate isomerase/epimerase